MIRMTGSVRICELVSVLNGMHFNTLHKHIDNVLMIITAIANAISILCNICVSAKKVLEMRVRVRVKV